MGKVKRKRSIKEFAKDKNIEISVQRYLIDALSYMALGLFASLLIGTIFNTLGDKLHITLFTEVINPLAKQVTGPAIAVAIAYGLQAPPLVMFSCALVGACGNELGLLYLLLSLVKLFQKKLKLIY